MATKRYKSATGEKISFLITVSEVVHRVTFEPYYVTADEDYQAQIELSGYFTSNQIIETGAIQPAYYSTSTGALVGGAILTSEIKTAGTGYREGDILQMLNMGGETAYVNVLTVDAGAVETYGLITAGSGYTAEDELTCFCYSYGGSAFALKVLTVNAGAIATSEISAEGIGYKVGDLIEFVSGGNKAVIRVLTLGELGAVATYELVNAGTSFTENEIVAGTVSTANGSGFELTVLTVSDASILDTYDIPDISLFKAQDYPLVTRINQAREVLKGAPYRIPHSQLISIDDIMRKAISCEVSFSNLIV